MDRPRLKWFSTRQSCVPVPTVPQLVGGRTGDSGRPSSWRSLQLTWLGCLAMNWWTHARDSCLCCGFNPTLVKSTPCQYSLVLSSSSLTITLFTVAHHLHNHLLPSNILTRILLKFIHVVSHIWPAIFMRSGPKTRTDSDALCWDGYPTILYNRALEQWSHCYFLSSLGALGYLGKSHI